MKFKEFAGFTKKEAPKSEAIESHPTEEQKEQIASLENLLRGRMINAIRFAPLGEQRVDERELDSMKESFSETMQKFGYTPEQTADTLKRLEAEAMQAAAQERE